MISVKNADLLNNLLYTSINKLPLNKSEVIDKKVSMLFQIMHIYRAVTIPDELFNFEDPHYKTLGGTYTDINAIYVSPVWSLFDTESIFRFKTFLEEQVANNKIDLLSLYCIIPGMRSGIFNPKEAKLIDENSIKHLHGVELMYVNKVYNKVKNNLISF